MTPELKQLAGLYGVQTAYQDVFKRRRSASPESVLATLQILGAEIACEQDAPAAIERRRRELCRRIIEPVLIAWDGRPPALELTLPARRTPLRAHVCIQLEDEPREHTIDLHQAPLLREEAAGGEQYIVRRAAWCDGEIPRGYHRLTVTCGEAVAESTLISAPRRSYSPFPEKASRTREAFVAGDSSPGRADKSATTNVRSLREWGVFLPLYALRSEHNQGAGDFTDLERLIRWTGELGGRLVGTLPMLAAFLDEPCDPSPYSPVSRLFWNELYIDLTAVPELESCPQAKRLLESSDFNRAIGELRASELVEYRRLMACKRRVLEQLAHWFFENRPAGRFGEFRRYVDEHPSAGDYAAFRAVCETRRAPWHQWPEPLRSGELPAGSFDERLRSYHLYMQWIAAQQLAKVAGAAGESGAEMYLDLPLGVRRDGYDVWRFRESFATGASAGAPPDAVFTRGQDWSFAPLHPEAIRRDGYSHVRGYLQHHLALAGVLRIDHVMGLHRLYWIPGDFPPSTGVYVRYRADEMYAILNLESHRHRTRIIGENLGTVPRAVDRAMERHRLRQLYVVQYELQADQAQTLEAPPRLCIASLNTHDMPPFAAWWECHDLVDRLELELLDETEAREERRSRAALQQALLSQLRREGCLSASADDYESVLQAVLEFLARSPAELLLINLEDLWGERRPQNIPGTGAERLNWKRKAQHTFEEFSRRSEVLEMLRRIDAARRGVDVGAGE